MLYVFKFVNVKYHHGNLKEKSTKSFTPENMAIYKVDKLIAKLRASVHQFESSRGISDFETFTVETYKSRK